MGYNYEELGDENFQRLAQSLIVEEYPKAQLLPVGMPDGGRDAFQNSKRDDRVVAETVFQVKFTKSPTTRDARDAVEETIRLESAKIELLIAQGLKTYILITNVGGTSHRNSGSIDRANDLFQKRFPTIACECWWRDDIDGRLRNNTDLVWSFPEITRGTDVLGLISKAHNEQTDRRNRAIRSLVAEQFASDEDVKFREIELRFPISEIYVDTPIRSTSSESEEFRTTDVQRPDNTPSLQYLLGLSNSPSHIRILIEGAPGQGKSTVTQFVCQVSRALFLERTTFLATLPPQWRPSSLRVPLRADLRDFATWLLGKSPFGAQRGQPHTGNQSLDAFLAELVSSGAGGIPFDVNDLHAAFGRTRLLLVLDGFDEVADPETRITMAREVNSCLERLEETCVSVHAIVTTRPSALITTPVFNERAWTTLELQNLTSDLAIEYATKWAKIKRLDQGDTNELINVLRTKLDEPHIRELSRNPMQLAILSTLINIQSDSLPSKRTALYADYIRIFFDRESQKSSLVKCHRQLLIMIHEHLAFCMHCEAEHESTSQYRRPGTLSLAEVKEKIGEFLERRGSRPDLLDGLFSAVQERVVALVQNIQGTYEFQVQPLREYFAAQHLYKSAVTVPGVIRGSRPDIYSGIAASPYWENVTRFYAGCYNAGELSSLIDDTSQVADEEDLFSTTFFVEKMSNFLRDYVFETHPRLIARAIESIFSQTPLDIHLSMGAVDRTRLETGLPEECGGPEYCERIQADLAWNDADRVFCAARLLKGNMSWNDRVAFAHRARAANPDISIALLYWYLDVIEDANIVDLSGILEGGDPELFRYACYADRGDFFSMPGREVKTFQHIVDGSYSGGVTTFGVDNDLGRVVLLLSPHMMRPYIAHGVRSNLTDFTAAYYGGIVPTGLSSWVADSIDGTARSALDLFVATASDDPLRIAELWAKALAEFYRQYGPTASIVLAATRWAVEAVEIGFPLERTPVDFHLYYEGYINRGNPGWWSDRFEQSKGELRILLTQAYIAFAVPLITKTSHANILSVFEGLPPSSQEAARGLLRMMPDDTPGPFPEVVSELQAFPKSVMHFIDCLDEGDRAIASSQVLGWEIAAPRELAELVFENLVHASLEGRGSWEVAVEAGLLARQKGGVSYGINVRAGTGMPLELAKRVISNTQAYPLTLIHYAQKALLSDVVRRVPKVGQVAVRNDWFSQT